MSEERIEVVVSLVVPAAELGPAFLDVAREYRDAGDNRYSKALENFPAYLCSLEHYARGDALLPGHVPATTFWLVREGPARRLVLRSPEGEGGSPSSAIASAKADGEGERTVLGVCNLRHRLNAHLVQEGGHIGYNIRPSERRKGYGTLILKLALEKARARGLDRVLVTCDTDNLGSARIIQKNGGRIENEVISPRTGKPVSRYWIDLSAPPAARL